MAYIPYITAWGRVIRQDEEPTDKYSVTWGQVKTYYEAGAAGTIRELIASIEGASSTGAADINVTRALSASIAGASSAQAAGMSVTRALGASIAGTSGTATIDLNVTRALSASIAGASETVAAAMEVVRALSAAVSGESDTSEITLSVAGIIELVADIAASSSAAVVDLAVTRLLQASPGWHLWDNARHIDRTGEWTVDASNSLTFSAEDECYRFEEPAKEDTYLTASLTEGRRYTMSMSVKSGTGSTNVILIARAAAGSPSFSSDVLSTTADWTTHSFSFTSTVTDAAATFGFYTDMFSGDICVRDFCVVEDISQAAAIDLNVTRALTAAIGAGADASALDMLVTRLLAAAIAGASQTSTITLVTGGLGALVDLTIESLTAPRTLSSVTTRRSLTSLTADRTVESV